MFTDSCPCCCRRGIAPARTRRRGDAIAHTYRCPDCRHTWTCGWGIQPDRVMPPETAGNAQLIGDLLDRYVTAQIFEQAAVNRARKHLAKDET